eukprot:UN03112
MVTIITITLDKSRFTTSARRSKTHLPLLQISSANLCPDRSRKNPFLLRKKSIPLRNISREKPKETPVHFLSKKHGHGCNKGLKNIAQDWDAGTVCGTIAEEMTLSCDPNRAGARIFVMAVKPKLPHQHGAGGADANVDTGVIEDTTSSVENEPFLAKHGHHGHNHGHKNKKGKGKNLKRNRWASNSLIFVLVKQANARLL